MSESFIPLSVPNLKGNELAYVTNAVQTEWVSTGGPYVNEFEEKIASYVHVKGAVSCQNGTSGLHVALLLSGVTREDAVIVPTLTFIAAVNPVRYVGASPIFMDCDDSLCMDPKKLRRFCEEECDFWDGKLIERQSGRQVKTIVVVHVFGNMADMEAILEIARNYQLKVIEDATEALGTFYTSGKYQGCFAGTLGDIGVYSFNGNKIITTGGGGMIVSNHMEYIKRAKHLTTQAKSDELYYTHDEIGYNYRMTNLQAALGLAQLEQLEDFIAIKAKNYELYYDAFSDLDKLGLLEIRKNIRWNCWFYALLCREGRASRDTLIHELGKRKIQTRPIWGLIHEQLPYQGSQTYQIECANFYIDHIINIPCSSNLKAEDVKRVIYEIKSIIS